MKSAFVELTEFTEWVSKLLPDESYSDLQQELMKDPYKGDVMPGCGGLRKVRTSDPKRGKGKRGGARVVYLYAPEIKWFYMLDIYDKDEKEDLSVSEKRALSKLVAGVKCEAKAVADRQKERREHGQKGT